MTPFPTIMPEPPRRTYSPRGGRTKMDLPGTRMHSRRIPRTRRAFVSAFSAALLLTSWAHGVEPGCRRAAGQHSAAGIKASHVDHRLAPQRAGRLAACPVRSGVSPVVRLLRRQCRPARRLARAGPLDEIAPAVRSGRSHSPGHARIPQRLCRGEQAVVLRPDERVLPAAPAAARGHARLHAHHSERSRPVVVRRGNCRAAGYASPRRRPAHAQRLSDQSR